VPNPNPNPNPNLNPNGNPNQVCDPVNGMHSEMFGGVLAHHIFAPRPTSTFGEGDAAPAVEADAAELATLLEGHRGEAHLPLLPPPLPPPAPLLLDLLPVLLPLHHLLHYLLHHLHHLLHHHLPGGRGHLPYISPTSPLYLPYISQMAAVILEPIVQGAGGMRMYSAAYLKRVRRLLGLGLRLGLGLG